MERGAEQIQRLTVNTIRMLSAEMIEKANSGHPGMALGLASPAYALWSGFLKHNPCDPHWFNRDRFILSCGHGSALLYSLLHLTGYDLSMEDLKQFRQWKSRTPGHPERNSTPGVEATTGPLGQGFAMGLGLALAERFLSCRYNRPGLPLVDHYIYALVSDGDLMEGVALEAASLAGTLKLHKLIYIYDDNRITIEGGTDKAFTEDVAGRFAANNWFVLKVEDSENIAALQQAIAAARSQQDKPSLIIVRTHIGYGSPKQDSAKAHGEPLGPEALAATRKNLNWDLPPFVAPQSVYEHMQKAVAQGRAQQTQWEQVWARYQEQYPQEAKELACFISREMPADWREALPRFTNLTKPLATRSASGVVINALAQVLPNLVGGAADLGPSTNTVIHNSGDMRPNPQECCGRNLHFGVREHAMGAIINGMAMHGGMRPFGATFFVFADYMRPPLRMAALMKLPSVFVFTHDSLAVGEDGPTHQPVEQLMSLRIIPGLEVWRPADANETAAVWAEIIGRGKPAALVLTRQTVPVLDPELYPLFSGPARGGYIIKAEEEELNGILAATGSEVHLALQVKQALGSQGRGWRVVSLPCLEVFAAQPEEYRQSVLPLPQNDGIKRLTLEAGVTMGWERWVGPAGPRTALVGVDKFGSSGPGKEVMEKYGFSVETVLGLIKDMA